MRHVNCWLLCEMNHKKVLLVDDDPVFVKAVSTKLRGEGFEVTIAEDGASTLCALREVKPDLILLDILFPPDVPHGGVVSWDGFDIMNWLRRMGGITKTPVILVTSSEPVEFSERARNLGVAAWVRKTGDSGELMRAVHQTLEAYYPAECLPNESKPGSVPF
jgi:CheY-like chemotaxis protein